MIAAAGVLARNWTRGRLIVAAVVDEEHESLGAEALVKRLARRRGDRDRAHRSRPRDRPQGLRVARDRDARPGRARQPARRGPRRDRANGPRARGARRPRPRAARAAAGGVSGHRLAPRVDHQRRPRAQQLSRSVHAADGAAHGRERGRRHRARARSTRSSSGSVATIRNSARRRGSSPTGPRIASRPIIR